MVTVMNETDLAGVAGSSYVWLPGMGVHFQGQRWRSKTTTGPETKEPTKAREARETEKGISTQAALSRGWQPTTNQTTERHRFLVP